MAGTYKLRKSQDQKFFFNLLAENDEKILTSETYNAKSGALNGIESVRQNSQSDSNYKHKQSTRGLPYFVLVAANGEIIGTGEEYTSPAAMDKGIAAVKRLASDAVVKDLSKT